MKYLLDASALYSIFESEQFPLVSDISVLVLTKYEVGNVVWKKSRKGEIKNLTLFTNALSEFFANVHAIDIDFDSTEQIAIKRDISFYDAAYIEAAERMALTLVTEDKEILEKSKNAVTPESVFKK